MPFNKSKPVPQLDMTGCGVACAAWITGTSYATVKTKAAQLGVSISDPKLWSGTDHVRLILKELGVTLNPTQEDFSNWTSLPSHSLLAVKYHLEKGIPHWHWVVSVNRGENVFVMDPKKALQSNIRTDFGRMKPKWFLEIL
ncbi:MAG: cysteine peptidase family C39 domain-containing protein [Sneathiella sp.]